MKVQFNQSRTKVLFSFEDGHEYKFLHGYPAFHKEGPYFYLPAKSQIVYNVYHRLKRAKKVLKVSQEVLDFINAPFKLKALPEAFMFHTTPKDYQEISLRYLYTVESGGLLLDPGMGKSKVVLDYIYLMKFKKSLVVCPLPLLFVWEDEIKIHRPELTFYSVQSTDWEVEVEAMKGVDVVIMNYNKAVNFETQLKTFGFEFMHLDEFLIKDVSTARTQSLTDISYHIPYRCGGSGTLINNSVQDAFCPIRYLEPSLVGGSMKKFNDRFSVKQPVKGPEGETTGKMRIVAFKGVSEIRSILESCCIVMTKDKWLKLPEKKHIDIHVPLNQEQKDAYNSLQRNYIAKIGGVHVEVDNALVKMSKLYQISNGFIYHTPKEDAQENEVGELIGEDTKGRKKKLKRTTIFFENSAKLAALKRLVTETIPGRRSIIWFNMQAEYTLIQSMLEQEGKRFLTIKGGDKRIGDKVRQFNSDPSFDYLLCQAKSVNYGVTVLGTTLEKLEEADYQIFTGISPAVYTEIFYSTNFSAEVYSQQEDRIHRLGQTNVCEYYRIFATTGIEKRIRNIIEDKLILRHEMLIDIAEKLQTEDELLV